MKPPAQPRLKFITCPLTKMPSTQLGFIVRSRSLSWHNNLVSSISVPLVVCLPPQLIHFSLALRHATYGKIEIRHNMPPPNMARPLPPHRARNKRA